MHVSITAYSLDHAAARRCTRGSTIIRWRGECRWQPTDSISLPSLWMASTASLTCGAIPRVCPSSYHHAHNSYLFILKDDLLRCTLFLYLVIRTRDSVCRNESRSIATLRHVFTQRLDPIGHHRRRWRTSHRHPR